MNDIATHRAVLGEWSGNTFVETGPRPKFSERAAPPPEPKSSPNCRLTSGGVPQGSRYFTSADGPFFFTGDLIFHVAITRPVPGSLTEQFTRRCIRNLLRFRAAPASSRVKKKLRTSSDCVVRHTSRASLNSSGWRKCDTFCSSKSRRWAESHQRNQKANVGPLIDHHS